MDLQTNDWNGMQKLIAAGKRDKLLKYDSAFQNTNSWPLSNWNLQKYYLEKTYAKTVGTTAVVVEAATIWSYEGMIGGL